MEALVLVTLTALMDLSNGNPEITIAFIGGPVLLAHPALIRAILPLA